MIYYSRLSKPSKSNKYFLRKEAGGVNECIAGKPQYCNGSTLANCVGYAWGRAYEILGTRPKLSRGDAGLWFKYADGYKRGQKPKLGAVGVWQNGNSGGGHVAVVEQIEGNKVTFSNSGYNGYTFYLKTYKDGFYDYGAYTFRGFIYLGDWSDRVDTYTDFIKSCAGATLTKQQLAVTGAVANLYLEFGGGTVAAGDTITLTIDKFLPTFGASGCGYWSKSAFIAQLSQTGFITIRNTGASRTFTKEKPLRIAITYIYKE